jgi:hypothetical protein
MTFQEFQATRKRADDIQSAINSDLGFDEGVSGYVYHGDLHIFDLDKGGFELVIGNVSETSEDLTELEQKLYAWGKDEGVID